MRSSFSLFEVFGVESEYMIVSREDLKVQPLADRILFELGAGNEAEVVLDTISVSNELVNHVIEFKSTEPVPVLLGLDSAFAEEVQRVNRILEHHGAMLMPGGMHPFMDPLRDTQLWSHDGSAIYRQFDRIFGCRSHAWANVQSVHLNLPFAGDDEFARLHAAVRVVLPLIPALAASSLFLGGKSTAWMDKRLDLYRAHTQQIPSLTGRVIPEPVFSRAEYSEVILEPLFRDLAAFDSDGILRHEWANARGAIARFDRNAIEVRLIDAQECSAADIAVCYFLAEVIRALVKEELSPFSAQKYFCGELLERLLVLAALDAEQMVIKDRAFLALFGLGDERRMTLAELCWSLAERLGLLTEHTQENSVQALLWILQEGPLARRIVRQSGGRTEVEIIEIYRELAKCLQDNRCFGR